MRWQRCRSCGRKCCSTWRRRKPSRRSSQPPGLVGEAADDAAAAAVFGAPLAMKLGPVRVSSSTALQLPVSVAAAAAAAASSLPPSPLLPCCSPATAPPASRSVAARAALRGGIAPAGRAACRAATTRAAHSTVGPPGGGGGCAGSFSLWNRRLPRRRSLTGRIGRTPSSRHATAAPPPLSPPTRTPQPRGNVWKPHEQVVASCTAAVRMCAGMRKQ
mmetsp:Transcript_5069/g.15374  ORF Transcript_5069/g.15374 Transcript_5069/m.15374 type:complete len:217 (-) Transcript_5069:770-1420(-)